MRLRRYRWTCVLVLAALAAWACAASAAMRGGIDTDASWAGFTLKTRWGQTLEGRFPVMEADLARTEGERKRVVLRLSTRDVEIIGYPRYTEFTRGEGFFNATRHPHVVFVSDAYPPALLRDGGTLAGDLTIRGTTRREVFTVEPAACDRPGIDCDVLATGVVYRGDFHMDRWGFALSDRVRMVLRLRLRGDGA